MCACRSATRRAVARRDACLLGTGRLGTNPVGSRRGGSAGQHCVAGHSVIGDSHRPDRIRCSQANFRRQLVLEIVGVGLDANRSAGWRQRFVGGAASEGERRKDDEDSHSGFPSLMMFLRHCGTFLSLGGVATATPGGSAPFVPLISIGMLGISETVSRSNESMPPQLIELRS